MSNSISFKTAPPRYTKSYLFQQERDFTKATGYPIHIAQMYTGTSPSKFRVYRKPIDGFDHPGLETIDAVEMATDLTAKEAIVFIEGIKVGLKHSTIDFLNPNTNFELERQ